MNNLPLPRPLSSSPDPFDGFRQAHIIGFKLVKPHANAESGKPQAPPEQFPDFW